MANEISITSAISCTNGNFILPSFGGAFNDDQTTAGGGVPGMLDLTTAAETIDVSEITTEGWAWFKNVGANQAEIGISGGGYGFQAFALVPAGLPAGPFKLVTTQTYQAKATTGTTRLQTIILDD